MIQFISCTDDPQATGPAHTQTLQLSRLRRDSHDFGLNLKLTRLSLKISRLKFLTHSLALQEELSLRLDESRTPVLNCECGAIT